MLALITGRGGLPAAVAAQQDQPPFVCALEGMEPDGLAVDQVFRLETLGSLLDTLQERGVKEVCLCGAIARPEVDPARIDAATLPFVPALQKALVSGDDGALRAIIRIFESRGFRVRGAHELAPDLLIPPGILSDARPDAQQREDAVRGAAVLEALAGFDIGQACVVGAGQVLGIEALGGTDHLLNSLPDVPTRRRALLVKRPKRGQDLRADMPTIGPETMASLRAAGLAGLVVEAGQVIILDHAETIARANEAGLILWSRQSP